MNKASAMHQESNVIDIRTRPLRRAEEEAAASYQVLCWDLSGATLPSASFHFTAICDIGSQIPQKAA